MDCDFYKVISLFIYWSLNLMFCWDILLYKLTHTLEYWAIFNWQVCKARCIVCEHIIYCAIIKELFCICSFLPFHATVVKQCWKFVSTESKEWGIYVALTGFFRFPEPGVSKRVSQAQDLTLCLVFHGFMSIVRCLSWLILFGTLILATLFSKDIQRLRIPVWSGAKCFDLTRV